MKKVILYALVVVVAVLVIVFVVRSAQNKQIENTNVQIVDTPQTSDTTGKQIGSKPGPTADRVPTKFACVGEYCDGSMSGENNFTVVKIPLVKDGGNIGCNAGIFFAPHTVPKTTAVLDATYKLLFDIKPIPEIPADGFRNVVGAYTRLHYDSVTLTTGIAKVFLTGTMYGPGHCAEPELRAQMVQAALQFPTVNRVEIYLNNELFNWCSMDVSDGEGPCPETPDYWVGTK